MRNGFRSSRGAMRGTMGGAPSCLVGAVGFATVGIGVGAFVYSICLRNASFTWPKFGSSKFRLSVRGKLPRINGIRIAAGSRTKVYEFVSVAERNGARFIHVHSTYGIAYQSARTRWDCDPVCGMHVEETRSIPFRNGNEIGRAHV